MKGAIEPYSANIVDDGTVEPSAATFTICVPSMIVATALRMLALSQGAIVVLISS